MQAARSAKWWAFLTGLGLVLMCELARTRMLVANLGAAWSGSFVLLGFVCCAASLPRESQLLVPKGKLATTVATVVAKALSVWILCYGLAHLSLSAFCVVVVTSAIFTAMSLLSGMSPVSAAIFAGATISLALSCRGESRGASAARSFTAALTTLCGASLASGLGLAYPRGWVGLEGFFSVAMLASIGVLHNLFSSSSLMLTSNLFAPVALFAMGVLLCFTFQTTSRSTTVVPTTTGVLIGCVALRIAGAMVFPLHSAGLLYLIFGGVCTVALARTAARQFPLDSGDTSPLAMRPSLLFSGGAKSTGQNGLLHNLPTTQRERKLAAFLCLTVAIMFVEFGYGVSVNSLGLISDSFHMMLDGASIAIGLYTAHAASWSANEKTHPFGYGRYEVLGGFVNGVLLVFIAFYVMLESVERLVDPPEITASYLLLVSIIGLVVNIIGVIFFHDSHGHSHSHGHGHGECGATQHVDHNMRGVYLHILADLLGSVSVIVSSLFIYFFNFWIADPICSALSATLILLSAFPLLEETGKILLLSGPPCEGNFSEELRKDLLGCGLLVEADIPKVWMHSTAPREYLFCLISAKMKRDGVYATTRSAVLALAEKNIRERLGVDDTSIIVNLE